MINGWFIGDFSPSILRTSSLEIGIKKYKKNDYEMKHYHKIATEITVIVLGKVMINKMLFSSNDIIIVEPNEAVEFKALENTITLVIKIPSLANDKFYGMINE